MSVCLSDHVDVTNNVEQAMDEALLSFGRWARIMISSMITHARPGIMDREELGRTALHSDA